MFLELFILLLFTGIIVTIIVLLVNKKKKIPASTCPKPDPNGVYDASCKLTDCTGGFVQDGTTCKSPQSPPLAERCEDVDPDICGTSCTLPFTIANIMSTGVYTPTDSKVPTQNFKQYKTVDDKYCVLDSCKSGTKNSWWCDTPDCDSNKHGGDGTHSPDPNASWTYTYKNDGTLDHCVFQACNSGYVNDTANKLCVQGVCLNGQKQSCNPCEGGPNPGGYQICQNNEWADCNFDDPDADCDPD